MQYGEMPSRTYNFPRKDTRFGTVVQDMLSVSHSRRNLSERASVSEPASRYVFWGTCTYMKKVMQLRMHGPMQWCNGCCSHQACPKSRGQVSRSLRFSEKLLGPNVFRMNLRSHAETWRIYKAERDMYVDAQRGRAGRAMLHNIGICVSVCMPA
jgi:hypothetical protein